MSRKNPIVFRSCNTFRVKTENEKKGKGQMRKTSQFPRTEALNSEVQILSIGGKSCGGSFDMTLIQLFAKGESDRFFMMTAGRERCKRYRVTAQGKKRETAMK